MSSKPRAVINAWIKDFLPEDMPFGEINRLAKAANLHPASIRQIRSRERLSAETIVAVMLARGVAVDDLVNIAQRGESSFSKSLSEWNHLGNTLSDKQREHVIKLVKFILGEWKIKA
jgi:hypothetical protein